MKNLLLLSSLLVFCQLNGQQIPEIQKPVHQLRIYELTRKNRAVFHDRFRDHAARIMRKYDFNIVSIWETQSDSIAEFIYLLEWKDIKSLNEGWEKFMMDQEWKDIKKETSSKYGNFVENITNRILLLQDYSPNKKFLD